MSNIIDQYRIEQEPYYRPVADEVALFEAAYSVRMPMMLKGPTGCGKTRFVEYMAHKLGKPLITVACNEDMTASDLVGRFLLSASGTEWQDGPLAIAARHGAICYLDEIVEARQDTTVVIHPLTDNRRVLPLEKKGELVHAHPDFQIVISYNPGYQSLMKDLKQSTKQRFGGLDFTYPDHAIESEIVAHESGVSADIAGKLVSIAERSPQPQGPRPGRRPVHPHADLRRQPHRQGRRAPGRLPRGAGAADHRRSGHARRAGRGRIDLFLSGQVVGRVSREAA
jgi:nitric oxide reductase NorQ protein